MSSTVDIVNRILMGFFLEIFNRLALFRHTFVSMSFYFMEVQLIADRVAQKLEIISKKNSTN